MNIDRLKYFAAVVECGNIRKASELVGISPGSMSKAITTLEHELGLQLIRPEGRGIAITEQGLNVYRNSASLLDECRRFSQAITQRQENKTRHIRLGTFEVFSSYFMSQFLAENYENDECLLLELTPGRLERAVLDGIVDFGITYLPSPDAGLAFTEIGSFKMGIFGLKSWEKKDFDLWPFAVPTTEFHINSSEFEALDMWPRQAPKRKSPFRFELLESALQTSRHGLSVLHCPEFIVKLQNQQLKTEYQLSRLKTPPGYRATKASKVFLVNKKGSEMNHLERKLARFFRRLTT